MINSDRWILVAAVIIISVIAYFLLIGRIDIATFLLVYLSWLDLKGRLK